MCCNSVSKRFCNPFPLRPRLGTCAYFLEMMMMMPTPRMLLCFLILSKGWAGTSATRFKRERQREGGREIEAELLLLSLPSPPWKSQDSTSSRIIPTSSTADI
ncbi:unnamed protein product [Sphagnum jensenii]|uniref:Secreted protein n=1 Tax=Sphagnum jensenii TaxID=128206 RepID=A0ABP0XAK3_9BRYO